MAGTHRGRKIPFSTDPKTRPMKDRTREALFSRIGGMLDHFIAIDFFAGTGILALESLSRHADYAIAFEIDRQAVRFLREAAIGLQLDSVLRVHHEDAFRVLEEPELVLDAIPEPMRGQPWSVYFCPPYRLWDQEKDRMRRLVHFACDHAPAGSLISVEVELETPYDFLPSGWDWEARRYPPAWLIIGDRIDASTSAGGAEACADEEARE